MLNDGVCVWLPASGVTPTELTSEVAATLEPEAKGFRISRSALTLRAEVPKLDEATFSQIVPQCQEESSRC